MPTTGDLSITSGNFVESVKYAVVDIETTGLYHQNHGITEIAVVHFDGKNMEPAFHSLINPGRDIPQNVRLLTGIQNDILVDAPQFREVATELAKVLEGCIFVAHNVNFDYNFLKAAFDKLDIPFQNQRLCTMRFSRKILPVLRSYSLKSVSNALKINNLNEHRAAGDAYATALILRNLIHLDTEGVLEKLLNKRNRNTILPPAISKEDIEALPDTPGVYYFYDTRRNPIYIGKAKNLKRRVLSHFTASSSTSKKQIFQRLVTRIEHKVTSTEYEASLLEDAEIKKWWPRLNQAQKVRISAFAVIPYQVRSGKTRIGIIKTRERSDALAWFDSFHSARVWLYRILLEYEINPGIAGLYCPETFDTNHSETRIFEFINDQLELQRSNFLIRSTEFTANGFGVGVLNGKYKGFGHFEKEENTREEIESMLYLAPDSLIAKSIIRKMLSDENYKIHPI